MDEQETDRRILMVAAAMVGVSPDDDLCPDVDEYATMDKELGEKVRLFRNELLANFRERCRGGAHVQ